MFYYEDKHKEEILRRCKTEIDDFFNPEGFSCIDPRSIYDRDSVRKYALGLTHALSLTGFATQDFLDYVADKLGDITTAKPIKI